MNVLRLGDHVRTAYPVPVRTAGRGVEWHVHDGTVVELGGSVRVSVEGFYYPVRLDYEQLVRA